MVAKLSNTLLRGHRPSNEVASDNNLISPNLLALWFRYISSYSYPANKLVANQEMIDFISYYVGKTAMPGQFVIFICKTYIPVKRKVVELLEMSYFHYITL